MARINKNYRNLQGSYLFSEIARRTRDFVAKNPGVDVMRLGVGNTTEALPKSVIEGLQLGATKLSDVKTYTGYADEQGDMRLRKAISEWYAGRGVTVAPDDIFISDGAKSDTANIASIFSNDSVIAVQNPVYPVYVDSNIISGRSGVARNGQYKSIYYMDCTLENGFFPSVPDWKVDLIYICSPNNPTGAVATKEQLQEFVNFAREYKAVIIFDAAYAAYIKDTNFPRSIYEIPGAEECAIEISSFSKWAGFTGVRLGWSVVPKDLVVEDNRPGELHAMWNRRQTTMFNGASNIAQEGGLAVLSKLGQKECQEIVDYYMENARIIRDGLLGVGLTVYGGVNAPYVWVKTPNGMSSWEFFDQLLTECHVVTTPGVGFGSVGEGYVRFSAFGHRENIQKAVQSIEQHLRIVPFDKQKMENIIEQYPTPFHIYDERAIRKNARSLLRQFSWNSGFKEFFAVKALPNPYILQILKEEGFGVDCSSLSELLLVEKVGFSGEEIMFTSNNTPAEEYIKARELGAIINLDDISHIEYLEEHAGMPDTLCFRYNPGKLREGNAIIGRPEEAKYGLTKEQLFKAYAIAKLKGVKRFGLHTMVASNELNPQYFVDTGIMLFELAVEIRKKLNIKLEFINLGGGIGIPYRPDQKPVDLSVVSDGIRRAYDAKIVKNKLHPLHVFMENGRVITGPYGYLITRVIHTKDTYKQYVGTDATMANLMRPGMYGAYHHITVLGKERVPQTQTYDVVGSLCENNDKFAIDRQLPKIDIGDILVIHDTGAHGHAMGFQYNGKLRSAELLLGPDGSVQLIRRAETVNDYFATLDFSQLQTSQSGLKNGNGLVQRLLPRVYTERSRSARNDSGQIGGEV